MLAINEVLIDEIMRLEGAGRARQPTRRELNAIKKELAGKQQENKTKQESQSRASSNELANSKGGNNAAAQNPPKSQTNGKSGQAVQTQNSAVTTANGNSGKAEGASASSSTESSKDGCGSALVQDTKDPDGKILSQEYIE